MTDDIPTPARSASARRASGVMSTYERTTDAGGYSIATAKTGWIVEQWSRFTGSVTGRKTLVAYGSAGYGKDADLAAAHNEGMSIGDAVAYMASEGGGKVLRAGQTVQ